MKIGGKSYRTIWPNADGKSVEIIDQTKLPHAFETVTLSTLDDAARAIATMQVRGAPLIGATAAYGVALALRADASDEGLDRACDTLAATRPTAINLRWALDEMKKAVRNQPRDKRVAAAFARAAEICDQDVETNRKIGEHGVGIIRAHAEKKGGAIVNILTHCNAGWLACVDWGTALAPVYRAHDEGIGVHVWVDETRPRNQGASLTAFELGAHGVPHTLIADNAGGHLMQKRMVDLCIVGTDRTTATGDVANKIGTYLKALAARDNGVPFFVALPFSTIDWSLSDGSAIPIEERDSEEVTRMTGRLSDGSVATVEIAPQGTQAANYGFDVTPARLVTGFITERGVAPATRDALTALYPERRKGEGA
jgi:methylthioribose-1-phosphate isomerase